MASLSFPALTPADHGTYSVNVSGVGGGAVRSAGAALTVSGGAAVTGVRLTEVRLTNGVLSFPLTTVTGHTYEVQFKADLSDQLWSPLEIVAGDGTTRSISVTPVNGSGFIRVTEKP